LSAKVLNERLRKLTRYGILDKHSYPEVPPRVEYRLTEFGGRFAALLDNISNLQEDLDRGVDRVQGSTAAEIGGKVPGRDPESMHRAE
jgi:DNA-binding HxlR family transcriptional regulator